MLLRNFGVLVKITSRIVCHNYRSNIGFTDILQSVFQLQMEIC